MEQSILAYSDSDSNHSATGNQRLPQKNILNYYGILHRGKMNNMNKKSRTSENRQGKAYLTLKTASVLIFCLTNAKSPARFRL